MLLDDLNTRCDIMKIPKNFYYHFKLLIIYLTRGLYLEEAWETARSFVGGLDLTVRLLKSDDLIVGTLAELQSSIKILAYPGLV